MVENISEKIEMCKELVELGEQNGLILIRNYDVLDARDECAKEMEDKNFHLDEIDDDVLTLYSLCNRVRNYEWVSFHDLSEDINECWYEARYGANKISGIKLISVVKKINAVYGIKNPKKYPNKVAFGWNNAFNKENPKPYLYGCIRNYLKDNGVEVSDDEAKYIAGVKKDPMYKEWLEVRRMEGYTRG